MSEDNEETFDGEAQKEKIRMVMQSKGFQNPEQALRYLERQEQERERLEAEEQLRIEETENMQNQLNDMEERLRQIYYTKEGKRFKDISKEYEEFKKNYEELKDKFDRTRIALEHTTEEHRKEVKNREELFKPSKELLERAKELTSLSPHDYCQKNKRLFDFFLRNSEDKEIKDKPIEIQETYVFNTIFDMTTKDIENLNNQIEESKRSLRALKRTMQSHFLDYKKYAELLKKFEELEGSENGS